MGLRSFPTHSGKRYAEFDEDTFWETLKVERESGTSGTSSIDTMIENAYNKAISGIDEDGRPMSITIEPKASYDVERYINTSGNVKEKANIEKEVQEYRKLKSLRSFRFAPRGIGSNWLPCFVCSAKNDGKCQPDMAAFVANKDEGEKVVALFKECGLNAKLDFRPSEPDWVQVKVGCCEKHFKELNLLEYLTKQNNIINKEILEKVKNVFNTEE